MNDQVASGRGWRAIVTPCSDATRGIGSDREAVE
jgi:hypothetical protein